MLRVLPGDLVSLLAPVVLYERTAAHRVCRLEAGAVAAVCGVSVPCAPHWGAVRVLLAAGPGLLGWTSANGSGALWETDTVVRDGAVCVQEP